VLAPRLYDGLSDIGIKALGTPACSKQAYLAVGTGPIAEAYLYVGVIAEKFKLACIGLDPAKRACLVFEAPCLNKLQPLKKLGPAYPEE
jgi:hypothetical protein